MNALALNFHNRFSALGSTHGKQHAILPALRRHLGASILLTQTLDTDRFGALRGCGEHARGGGATGLGITDVKRGLPCAWREQEVALPVAQLARCDHCHLEIEEKFVHVPATADPRHCCDCNP